MKINRDNRKRYQIIKKKLFIYTISHEPCNRCTSAAELSESMKRSLFFLTHRILYFLKYFGALKTFSNYSHTQNTLQKLQIINIKWFKSHHYNNISKTAICNPTFRMQHVH